MRMLYMLKKEIYCSKENWSFHLVSIISPLLFLLAFSLMLSGGITFPMEVHSTSENGLFEKFLNEYSSPSGEEYFDIKFVNKDIGPQSQIDNFLEIIDSPSIKENNGKIKLVINDGNANMTKNYRNRVHGAILEFINKYSKQNIIHINEYPMYKKDIPWDASFGVSILAFGMMLAGLLFGMLSITYEWENGTHKFIKMSSELTSSILAAKAISSIIKSFIAIGCLSFICFCLFNITLNRPIEFMCVMFISSSIFILLGMLIGHCMKNTITSFLAAMIVSLSLWIGGGGFGPLAYFGNSIRYLGYLNPMTYIIELVRGIYFGGTVDYFSSIIRLTFFLMTLFIAVIYIFKRWCKKERMF